MSYFGAGASYAGVSVAGFGSCVELSETKKSYYITADGSSGDCRYYDPLNRDYRFNSDGIFEGQDADEQQVALALLTEKGSAFITDFGETFSTMETIPQNYKRIIWNAVKEALVHLSDRIELVNVDVKRNNSRLDITIEWKKVLKPDLYTTRLNV